ncbi:uncharacterized protein LOC136032329 [Artemia franciscana]|uniref:uncharacterized protein LOC136032329 n=1 Tax=Artemia franciscana TaxID=6661 RepID=UPI0032DBD011
MKIFWRTFSYINLFKLILILLCCCAFYILTIETNTNLVIPGDNGSNKNNFGRKDDTKSCKDKGVHNIGEFCLDSENALDGYNFIWSLKFAQGLENIIKNGSILDLGAGLGNYGRYFLRKKEAIFPSKFREKEEEVFFSKVPHVINAPQIVSHYEGYDGTLNIAILTSGFIKHLVLATPQELRRKFDWVISVEAGEHIPLEFESVFIDNLIRHACKGIVMTYSIIKALSSDQNSSYIREQMDEKGWKICESVQKYLRNVADLWYLKNTVMVFVPKGVSRHTCLDNKLVSCV